MHQLRIALQRRRNRWLLLASALTLLVIGAVTIEVLRIRDDLERGRALLSEIDLATIDEQGGLAAVADRAADHLDDAAERARSSLVLRAVSAVPVVGSQVDGLRDITAAVASVGTEGRAAAAAIDDALDAGSGPAGRLEVIRVARRELASLREHVTDVDLGADGWLVPPLASARRMLAIELADARSDLDRSSGLAAALEEFLVGPRRYLVLGGNNAEMRAVGIPTTSGVAQIADGAIEVGEFSGATDGIELPEPGVPVPLEFEAVYGWLNGDRGYRTTLATANWPVAARIAADITERNQYGRVDGIIYVDTITLAVLLNVIGPVEIDGVEYSYDNVLDELLYRNYLRFDSAEDNPERKALQSAIAQAIFDEIDRRHYSVLELAGRLSELARGRHLLAWSEDPGENELWEAFGADGRLRRNGISVVSEDLGASKLDYHVSQRVEIDADRRDDYRRVTMRVQLHNIERDDTSPYIEGGGMFADAGEYGSWLVGYLPDGAFDIHISTGITNHGRDGPMYAAATIVRVPEGETTEVVFEFSLPLGQEKLTVIPSARLFGTQWRFGDEERIDALPFEIDLADID